MKALTREELQRLLDNTREPLRTMIRFAFLHGARVSELVGLKRADVDLRAGVVTLRRLKGSLTTQQPLSDAERVGLAKVLEQNQSSPYCFLMRSGQPISRLTFGRWFKRACLENGIDASKAHPHILKHACVTYLLQNKMPIVHVQVYVGHASIQSTTRYCHITDEEASAEAMKIFEKPLPLQNRVRTELKRRG